MAKFRFPTGSLSRRIYGAEMELRERAESARGTSLKFGDTHVEFAASLRGKFHAYTEAAEILAALQHGRTIPKRRNPRRTADSATGGE